MSAAAVIGVAVLGALACGMVAGAAVTLHLLARMGRSLPGGPVERAVRLSALEEDVRRGEGEAAVRRAGRAAWEQKHGKPETDNGDDEGGCGL